MTDAMIASFILPWEHKIWERRCVIEGCNHKCGPEEVGGVACADGNPASIVTDANHMDHLGFACPCCVDKLISR